MMRLNQQTFSSLLKILPFLVIGLGLILRFLIVSRDLDIIDRLFIPDDTYYTLSISRSLAQGSGPSVDGAQLTNGFQPLLAFLMVPAFWLSKNPDVPLRVVLILTALCGLANALLLARLASRLAGRVASLAAAAMWSFSPVALAVSFDGLETALALTISLILVEFWCRAHSSGKIIDFMWAGVFVGLVLLARVDTAFLVGLLGLYELIFGNKKGVFISAAIALLIVSPWWIYSILKFSTPVPESGAAVRMQVSFHQSLYLNTPKQISWTVGTIIGVPFFDAQSLRQWLFKNPGASILFALVLLWLLAMAMKWVYRNSADRGPLLALSGHGILIACFYAFYLPALWFFKRYLHPTQAVATLLLAVLVAELWRHRSQWRLAFPGLFIFAVFLISALFQCMLFIWANPMMTPDVSLHGAKGYREVSRDVIKILPEGTILGAFQSGALAYFRGNKLTLVNLDGVVDGKAAKAICENRLGEYAQSRGVTYFADWPFNYNAFRYFGGEKVEKAEFRMIGAARPQGTDRTLISQIIWK